MEDKNLSIEFGKCQTSKRGEIIREIQLRFRLEIIIIVSWYACIVYGYVSVPLNSLFEHVRIWIEILRWASKCLFEASIQNCSNIKVFKNVTGYT